jgi:hypothetical protein
MERQMIRVEHNTLVLDTSHTRDDQKAINDFLEYKIQETKVSLLKAVQEIEEQSHKTRTPIYQDTLFELVYNKINSL